MKGTFYNIDTGTKQLQMFFLYIRDHIFEDTHIENNCILDEWKPIFCPKGTKGRLTKGRLLFCERKISYERVGSKSHCRAVPAVPSPIWCDSNLIFVVMYLLSSKFRIWYTLQL